MKYSLEDIVQFFREFWVHIAGVCAWYGIYMFWGHVAIVIIKIIFDYDKITWDEVVHACNIVGFILGIATNSYRKANKGMDDHEDPIMTQEEFDKNI